jgi:hypothetical protein
MTWRAGLGRIIKKRRADPANNVVIDRGVKDVVAIFAQFCFSSETYAKNR